MRIARGEEMVGVAMHAPATSTVGDGTTGGRGCVSVQLAEKEEREKESKTKY